MTSIIKYLNATGTDLERLYQKADQLREKIFGETIYFRGIIEFSNYCTKNCYYCGIRKENTHDRYRMDADEIIETCKQMERSGITTVVLQSGEDPQNTPDAIATLIQKIKTQTSLAITLSIGEHSLETYKSWKNKGADRYLLRFETSNPDLYQYLHPESTLENRINCIKTLQSAGIQTGSGFLIGLPGQTLDDLAKEIQFCTDLNLDMIGVGPFIPHPDTPLGEKENPFDSEIYFKTIAILRLLNPKTHIPATTAFDAIHKNGRNLLLQRGCNIFMPNMTPKKYRKKYLLYPGKPCTDESSSDCVNCMFRRTKALNRTIGSGPGHSIKNEP